MNNISNISLSSKCALCTHVGKDAAGVPEAETAVMGSRNESHSVSCQHLRACDKMALTFYASQLS